MRSLRVAFTLLAFVLGVSTLNANAAGVEFSIRNMTAGTMHATITGEGYHKSFTLEFQHTIVLTGVPHSIHAAFTSYRTDNNTEICKHDSRITLPANGWKTEAVILTGRICYFRER